MVTVSGNTGGTMVTVALAGLPMPLALLPATVYTVVAVGVTTQTVPIVPTQLPPVQL